MADHCSNAAGVKNAEHARARCASATLILAVAMTALAAQTQPAPPPPAADRAHTEALARRAATRLQALHREADALAAQERTLLVELQRLEVERRLRQEELKDVTAEAAAVSRELEQTTARIQELEQHERTERPNLQQRLVDVYKLGRGGYLRMLLSVDNFRSVGRAYRTVASLSAIDRARVREHRRTVEELRASLTRLAERKTTLTSLQQAAQRARVAADRAAEARTNLVEEIDDRRDLNAQLAGELQAAQQKLQQALASMADGVAAVEPVALPLRPFQGDLDWPASGLLLQRFGQQRSRVGAGVVRNGIEIGGTDGASVMAVHDGTVAFADPFTGFGNLVIVDHGNQAFSLYGHLAAVEVARGGRIYRGQQVGTMGSSLSGAPALYFELRIDGKPVDPVQWLKKR